MKSLLRTPALLRNAPTVLLFMLVSGLRAQYLTGDYGAVTTGLWNSTSTWKVYNGVSWASSPAAGAVPNANNRVYILTGSTVTAAFGSSYSCQDLFIETGAKLFNNNTGGTNLSYIDVFGTTITVDGQLGNGATLDGISLGVNGSSVSLSGTGTADVARITKRATVHPMTGANLLTTNLSISMNVNLRFSAGSTTMMFNACTVTSAFNVTIGTGVTVALVGSGGSGNVSMDGLDGAGPAVGGAYTVNGTLLIPGILHLSTNNVAGAPQCLFTINNGGYVRASQLNSAASGAAGHVLTINAGGTLEVTGSPAWTAYGTVGNTFALNATSQFIYSATDAQVVQPLAPNGYGHLRITGGNIKSLAAGTSVRGNLEINNAAGTPVLDVTASNFGLNVGGNWSNYAQTGFEERNGQVNFNGNTSTQTLTTPGGEVFRTWQISKSGSNPTVVMNSNVTVTNNLNLVGVGARLNLNGNLLTISNPAATAITSSGFGTMRHILSERTDNTSRVAWAIGSTAGPRVFPFGSAAAYTPFTFNLASGDAGTVTVATYGTPPTNLPWPVTPTAVTNLASLIGLTPDNRDATVDRFWQVDVTGTPTAALTFGYASSELPVAPYNVPTALRAQRWNSSTGQWEPQLEGSATTTFTATANTVNTFGPFTLSVIASPLPVELIHFNAKAEGEEVRLEWATATEQDNALFTVYRSADGREFTPLLSVPGAGTSLQVLEYLAYDRAPLEGLSYYRLRQTDLDGSWTESDVVVVRFDRLSVAPALYPNPATDLVHVNGLPAEGAELRLLDATGRVLFTTVVTSDQRTASLQVTQLPAGAYRLLVISNAQVRSLSFVRP